MPELTTAELFHLLKSRPKVLGPWEDMRLATGVGKEKPRCRQAAAIFADPGHSYNNYGVLTVSKSYKPERPYPHEYLLGDEDAFEAAEGAWLKVCEDIDRQGPWRWHAGYSELGEEVFGFAKTRDQAEAAANACAKTQGWLLYDGEP